MQKNVIGKYSWKTMVDYLLSSKFDEKNLQKLSSKIFREHTTFVLTIYKLIWRENLQKLSSENTRENTTVDYLQVNLTTKIAKNCHRKIFVKTENTTVDYLQVTSPKTYLTSLDRVVPTKWMLATQVNVYDINSIFTSKRKLPMFSPI